MADKSSQSLPADWDDDDRMNFMFSAFPESRNVNPKHWDSKLYFWSKAILDGCKFHEDICIDLTTLKQRFSRNGLTPLGLNIVIREMLRQGKLERKQDFLSYGSEGWLSWSYGLAKRSFWWSVGSVWGGRSNLNFNEQLVLLGQAKENADWILNKHYEFVECETTDHIIPWNVLRARCKKFDDETLELLMVSLQKQSKAVLFTTPEGEKIVKFARKGEPKVAAVSDSDVDIVRLRKTVASLTIQANKLSNEVERLQAAHFVKEGSRSQALKLLKRKDLRQQSLDKTIANLSSFEEILHRIQNAHTNKMIIEALKSGTASLKGLQAQMSIESVEDAMDELSETLSVSQDIDSAIRNGSLFATETTGMASNELEELEQELESLTLGQPADAVTVEQPSSNPPQLPTDISSIAGHHSNFSRKAKSIVSDFDTEREALNWPNVPSRSPNETGIPETRDKTLLSC